MEKYDLETPWILWNHGIHDKSWTNDSYKNIYTINNLYDFKSYQNIVKIEHLQNSMFFIMREDIFPTWEDPDNRQGCCISFKIPNNVLKEQFDFILNNILSEDILIDKNNKDYLNGFSIIPKKEFNIVKLWLRNHDENYEKHLNIYESHFLKEKALIKKHELSD